MVLYLNFAILKLVNYFVPCTSTTYNKRELFPLKKYTLSTIILLSIYIINDETIYYLLI